MDGRARLKVMVAATGKRAARSTSQPARNTVGATVYTSISNESGSAERQSECVVVCYASLKPAAPGIGGSLSHKSRSRYKGSKRGRTLRGSYPGRNDI